MKRTIQYWYCLLCLSMVLQSCIGWDMWNDYITVNSVVNGNTLELENGINVVLLGIQDTKESQQWLSSYIGKKIRFVKDSSYPNQYNLDADNNTFYAYAVFTDDDFVDICLNSSLLKNKQSGLCGNPYLHDSLSKYKLYAENTDNEQLIVNPVVKPQLDTELMDFLERFSNTSEVKNIDHSHDAWMSDGGQNCEMLGRACDYTNSITKGFANLLASKSEGEFNIGQVCEIYHYLRGKWKYVNDPADNEYVAYASESIHNNHLSGDCDDFAVLMAACILSVGGNACINTADNGNSGHAFTEVEVSHFNLSEVDQCVRQYFDKYNIIPDQLSYRRDGSVIWMNLDWQTSYPGGVYWENGIYNRRDTYVRQGGQWVWKQIR